MSGPMRDDDPMRRSGARWCDVHSRWECARRTKAGGDCHEIAIAGRDVGRMHAGEKREVAKAKGEANLLAWSLVANEGEPVPDPAGAVMLSLRVAMARVEILGAELQRQYEKAGVRVHRLRQAGGLVGPTYAAGRDGERVETGEQIRALTKLEAEERERVVRFAKTAHDMGISERQLELEQAQAAQVVTAVGAGLEALALDGEDRDRFLQAFMGALGRPAGVVGEVVA